MRSTSPLTATAVLPNRSAVRNSAWRSMPLLRPLSEQRSGASTLALLQVGWPTHKGQLLGNGQDSRS